MSSATLAVLHANLSAVWKIRSTEPEVDCYEALTEIQSGCGDGVDTYIKEIDSIYWTVFDNMPMDAAS